MLKRQQQKVDKIEWKTRMPSENVTKRKGIGNGRKREMLKCQKTPGNDARYCPLSCIREETLFNTRENKKTAKKK